MTKTQALIKTITTLTLALLAAVTTGCGGGGATSRGQSQPAVPGNSPQFQALLPAGQRGAKNVGSRVCGGCHGTLPRRSQALASSDDTVGKKQRAKRLADRRLSATRLRQGALADIFAPFHQTVHAAKGVGCESCHGPGSAHVEAVDSNADKSEIENTILTFPNIASALVCGQCHTQIHQDWSVSKHHEFVVPVIEEAEENPAVFGRTCMRCHSALFRLQIVEKGINPATLPLDQIEEIVEATKTTVPNSSNCATCHDAHRKTGNLTDQGREVQLRHAVSNTNTAQVGPGATVDQYTTFNQACAECHNGRGANPSDAALTSGTARPNMHDSNQFNMMGGFGGVEDGGVIKSDAHFNIRGQCTTCHVTSAAGGHSFVPKLEKCLPCHATAEAASLANALKGDVQGRLLSLRSRLQRWAMDTLGDAALWDYTSAIQEQGKMPPAQANVPIQIKRARHNYYFVLRDASLGVHNGKYARSLLDVANRQLDALNVPRLQAVKASLTGRALLQSDRMRAVRADMRAP
jgi:hypothetical protein